MYFIYTLQHESMFVSYVEQEKTVKGTFFDFLFIVLHSSIV